MLPDSVTVSAVTRSAAPPRPVFEPAPTATGSNVLPYGVPHTTGRSPCQPVEKTALPPCDAAE